MVVNHKYKICYIQNPKCASTYVETGLKELPETKRTRKKHNPVTYFAFTQNVKNFKVFGTVRNPMTYYHSMFSFCKNNKSSHIWRIFGDEDFGTFVENLLLIRANPGRERIFTKFFEIDYEGFSRHNQDNESIGWGTFSYIYYFSLSPNFINIEENEFIRVFNIEDNLGKKLEEYLDLPEYTFPKEKINVSHWTDLDIAPFKQEILRKESFIMSRHYND